MAFMKTPSPEIMKNLSESWTFESLIAILTLSAILGAAIAITNFFAGRALNPKVKRSEGCPKERLKAIVASTNMLFFCVALTGVLLILDNSLMRAFIVVAAIAIVSFRVPIDSKGINSSILFAMLVGVSLGVREVTFALSMVVVYILLVNIIFAIAWVTKKFGLDSNTSLTETPTGALPGTALQAAVPSRLPMIISNSAPHS